MSIRRIAVLVGKELVRGPRSFMFVFAIVVPVVLTLLISLLFGTVFSGQARLGVFSEGITRLPALAERNTAVQVRMFDSPEALQAATESGAVDAGLIIPAGFDAALQSDSAAELTVFLWGQSLLRDRATVATAIISFVRTIAGQDIPVALETISLGAGGGIAWEDRLFPLVVLMTIAIGGVMMPATALVEEKQKRTLTALTITPTSLADVFASKAILGVIISVIMALVILGMNNAFGPDPLLLIVTLTLGATFASILGLILGAMIGDVTTLFTMMKAIGIVLYAPALIYLFPQLPSWVGQIFPTFYIIQPVVEITQQDAGWAAVAPDLAVLAGLILLATAVVALIVRRAPQSTGRFNPA